MILEFETISQVNEMSHGSNLRHQKNQPFSIEENYNINGRSLSMFIN
jgi:hypothetical protein